MYLSILMHSNTLYTFCKGFINLSSNQLHRLNMNKTFSFGFYTDEDLNPHNHLRWLYVLIHLSATFPLNDINSTPKRADLNLQRCKVLFAQHSMSV